MALVGSNNEQKIYNFLLSEIGNEYGVCGLMGNLYHESGLNPTNLQGTYEKKLCMTDAQYTEWVDNGKYQDFVEDSAGYGLAQWTYHTRKKSLYDYVVQKNKKSIGDLEYQLKFLIKEIKEYGLVWKAITEAKGINTACDSVLINYECPAVVVNRRKNPTAYNKVRDQRRTRAKYYYDTYHKSTTTSTSTNKKTTSKKYELGDKITNNLQLAEAARLCATEYKTLYVLGCFGAPMNDKNKKRYTTNQAYNKKHARATKIKKASADTFGFDCVCLIKGLLWGWNGDVSHVYGGATYKSNDVPDINADSMIKICTEVSTNMSDIEVGEILHMKGHVGVYIGNGLCVECVDSGSDGVQIRGLNQAVGEYIKSNKFTSHGKLPYIKYVESKDKDITGFVSKSLYKTISDLNLRSGAGANTKSLAVIPKGAEVECDNTYKVISGTMWMRVRYKGVVGYSSGKYLEVDRSHLKKGSEFLLTKNVGGYNSSGDAKKHKKTDITYKSGLYYVYKVHGGVHNISKSKTSPGAWMVL